MLLSQTVDVGGCIGSPALQEATTGKTDIYMVLGERDGTDLFKVEIQSFPVHGRGLKVVHLVVLGLAGERRLRHVDG